MSLQERNRLLTRFTRGSQGAACRHTRIHAHTHTEDSYDAKPGRSPELSERMQISSVCKMRRWYDSDEYEGRKDGGGLDGNDCYLSIIPGLPWTSLEVRFATPKAYPRSIPDCLWAYQIGSQMDHYSVWTVLLQFGHPAISRLWCP